MNAYRFVSWKDWSDAVVKWNGMSLERRRVERNRCHDLGHDWACSESGVACMRCLMRDWNDTKCHPTFVARTVVPTWTKAHLVNLEKQRLDPARLQADHVRDNASARKRYLLQTPEAVAYRKLRTRAAYDRRVARREAA